MSSMIQDSTRLGLSPLYRLQWEESQQRFVMLYPEGMVELNGPAAEILKLCDGTRSFSDMVGTLETAFDTQGLRSDIEELVQAALDHGWIAILS